MLGAQSMTSLVPCARLPSPNPERGSISFELGFQFSSADHGKESVCLLQEVKREVNDTVYSFIGSNNPAWGGGGINVSIFAHVDGSDKCSHFPDSAVCCATLPLRITTTPSLKGAKVLG